MPKQFDATLKDLICSHPEDWLRQFGVPITEPPEIVSADLSAVTAAADTLIRVGNLVVHIDVESGPDDSLAERMLLYNVLARHHTKLRVRTIAVLLRSNAQRASLTDQMRDDDLSFRFQIVRVWELPADDLLKAGVGLLPLAVLGKPPAGTTREQALPTLVDRIAERVEKEAKPDFKKLMTATFILASMHIESNLAREVIDRVLNLKDTPGYQYILKEGAVDFAREMILEQGQALIGEPTEKQAAKLQAIQDLERLRRIARKVLTAKSWDSLLRVS
jgi:predicted transposase YdaD